MCRYGGGIEIYMNKKQFLGVAYYPEAWDRSQIDEDLEGRAAITSTKYGKGRIVVFGFIPTKETLADVVTSVCADAGIVPFLSATDNVTVY